MTGRRLAWILLPLLTAALGLEIMRATRWLRASRIVALVKEITIEANRRGALSGALLGRNLVMLRTAEAENRVDVDVPIARGGQFMLLKRPKAAIRAYERALEIEPRGEVYAHLGRAYLEAGDLEAARRAFHRAVLLDHNQRRRLKGLMPKRPERARTRRDGATSVSSESFESGEGALEGSAALPEELPNE